MKVLVVSDSHGNVNNMVQAVDREQPDQIFHLGDCWRDGERLHELFPEIPFLQVPGNCDFRPMEQTEQLTGIDVFRVLLCHGHTYGVKQTMMNAAYHAEEEQLDLFLFGHTHRPLVDRRGKTLFINPGSIGDRRCPTYAIVTAENGKLDGRTVLLRD